MKLASVMLSTVVILSFPVYAQQTPPSPPAAVPGPTTTDPTEFAKMAAMGNMFEIDSSTAAKDKAQSAEVKAFAGKMIADHGKAGEEMAAAASSENALPPAELDATHQTQLDQLNAAAGEAFDKAYVAAQVKAHDDAVALFEAYSTSGPDGALKDFATKTLPTLKLHQEQIRDLAGTIGG